MLIPDPDQLAKSMCLVVTKKMNDGFSVQEKLLGLLDNVQEYHQKQQSIDREKTKIKQVINLLNLLTRDPDRVFSFPTPITTGPYNLFEDRRRLIESLKKDPVISPSHALSLEDNAMLFVLELVRKHAYVGNLILELTNLIRSNYKNKPLEILKNWERLILDFSGINRFDELGTVFKRYFPEGVPDQFRGLIQNFAISQRYVDFARKVMPEQIGNQKISIILWPFINNMSVELQHLIQHKELLNKQEQETKQLQDKINTGAIAQETANKQLETMKWAKNQSDNKIREIQSQLERVREENSAQLRTQLYQQQQIYDNEIETLKRKVQSASDQSETIASLRRQLREAEARADRAEELLLQLRGRSVLMPVGVGLGSPYGGNFHPYGGGYGGFYSSGF